MSEPVTLTAETVEAIAQRVAELLEPAVDRHGEMIDAAEVARRLGIRREAVYERAAELGAVRIGNGPRGRLRFDPERVAEALTPEPAPLAAPRPQRHRTRQRPAASVPLLPVGRKR